MTQRHYAGHDYELILECEAPLALGLVERLREKGIAARIFSPYTDLVGIVNEAVGTVGVWVPVEAAEEARRLLEVGNGNAGH